MLTEKNNNSDGSKPLDDCKLQVSAYSMQGRRLHMEDYFDIGYMMKPADKLRPNEWPYEYIYFGVFDGHGGSQAASFAKKNLLKLIVRSWKFWSDDDNQVLEAISEGFQSCHSAMYSEMPSWTRTNRVLPSTAGTTASILFIRNGKFYTGHVGDSRIVISQEHPETKNWRHEELTQDHKPENEVERIENAGGQVKAKIGVHRVVWKRPVLCKELEEKLFAGPEHPSYDICLKTVDTYPIDEALVDSYQTIPFLAIARSLGDFWSYNPNSEEFVVSPEPDVMCRAITDRDKCILLATDGLWNVMNSSQAIRFLQELKIVKEGGRDSEANSNRYFATDNFYDVSNSDNEANHALSLVYMAYQIWERRRLRSDNITAIVAMLSDIMTPQQMTGTNALHIEQINSISEREEGAIQIGDTRIVCQDISMREKPTFELKPEDSSECKILKTIDEYLLFPPSIIDTKTKSYHSCVKPPRNYFRLSNAKYRLLEHDDLLDEIIYVKEVSDDPADSIKLPTRMNSKNVEIRDSSSQATQAMHDFGQPWDQLHNYPLYRAAVESEELSDTLRSRTMDAIVEDDKHSENEEDEDKKAKLDAEEEDDRIIDDLFKSDFRSPNGDNDNLDDQPAGHPMEQVLSVVSENKTPAVRRSTRKSATENPKRKLEIEMSASPKTKRRKSHPIHTIAAVTKG